MALVALCLLRRILKFRRLVPAIGVLVIFTFVGYATVKFKSYGLRQLGRRENRLNGQNNAFPWQQLSLPSAGVNITKGGGTHFPNISSGEYINLVNKGLGTLPIKPTLTMKSFPSVERDKSDVFRKTEEFQADNKKQNLNYSLKREKMKQTFSKEYRLERAKLLKQFEEWKRNNSAILSNRTVPLKLPPPPHVNDSLSWKHMVESFPLVFRRLMRPFLVDYKNPCFLAEDGVYCLPYFIEIGAAKCGSTDMYFHITRHPKVVRIYKEAHFWTHMDKTDAKITQYLKSLGKFNRTVVSKSDKETLIFGVERHGERLPPYYSECISVARFRDTVDSVISIKYGVSGSAIITISVVKKSLLLEENKESIYGKDIVTHELDASGDGSPSYFWENYNIRTSTNGVRPFLWADVIHAVMPGTKIIAILRNPTNRTISDYFYSGKNQSPHDFHLRVTQETSRFNSCQKTRSLRTCANGRFYPRLHISVYIAHIREWLRLFPREQILILRTEDWHNHEKNNIFQQIFKFLEIDELSEAELPDIKEDKILAEIDSKKATEKKSKKLGNVLPETRATLDDFFEPYNKQLADLLADDKFLWKY